MKQNPLELLQGSCGLTTARSLKWVACSHQRERNAVNLHKIWIEQCQAARGIEDEFGRQKALAYLVGEKFLNYLDAADRDPDFRAEIPAFVAEIKDIFEPWQLAECLEKARQTEPFDHSLYDENDDPEDIEMERDEDLRRCAADLLLVERAREWLLGESDK
jgi:hypothetical protein